jgi:hypothetical protein
LLDAEVMHPGKMGMEQAIASGADLKSADQNVASKFDIALSSGAVR